MKPLVLTGWWTPDFMENDLADLVLDLAFLTSCGDRSPRQINLQPILALALRAITGPGPHIGRTGAPTGAQTESIDIGVWPNSVGNTKPSNYGST
jgi:hypothetical protein